MDWVSILGKISIWIILVPLLIGLSVLYKLDRDSRLVLLIIFIGTIPQVLNPFLKGTPALIFLYNLYTPFEFFIYWFLFNANIKGKTLRSTTLVIFYLFIVISIFLVVRNNLFASFTTVWVVVNNCFQLILAGLCLLTFFYSDENDLSRERPLFWYLIGIILYASCTVIFYSLWNYLKRNSDSSVSSLNIIHHVFNITLYVFFSIGLLKNAHRVKLNAVYE